MLRKLSLGKNKKHLLTEHLVIYRMKYSNRREIGELTVRRKEMFFIAVFLYSALP